MTDTLKKKAHKLAVGIVFHDELTEKQAIRFLLHMLRDEKPVYSSSIASLDSYAQRQVYNAVTPLKIAHDAELDTVDRRVKRLRKKLNKATVRPKVELPADVIFGIAELMDSVHEAAFAGTLPPDRAELVRAKAREARQSLQETIKRQLNIRGLGE